MRKPLPVTQGRAAGPVIEGYSHGGQQRTRVAGVGNDGYLYGVTSVTKSGNTYRRKPCATCPWRVDAPVGRFPAQAFRESASTAYDAAFNTFACHESGTEKPATCAGFLLRNSANNIGVRLAHIDPRTITAGNVELYESYRAMAVANGVDPADPVLARCRADDE